MKTLPEAKTDTVDFFVFQNVPEEFVATVFFFKSFGRVWLIFLLGLLCFPLNSEKWHRKRVVFAGPLKP